MKSREDIIYFTVKDSDWFSDSFIGEVAINMSEFIGSESQFVMNRWFPIFFKGQNAGKILLWGKYLAADYKANQVGVQFQLNLI